MSTALTQGVKPVAWVAAALVLLLVISAANPRIGGWLLIVLTMGMVYAAHGRRDANGQALI